MNRKIKFRVYDTEKKKLSYGFSIQSLAEETVQDVIESWVDNLVWQQYTGLTDQNGQEIYEGDILSFSKDSMEDYIVHAVVKYGTGEFDGGTYKYPGFYLESTGDDVNLKEGDIMEPYEITNLHDPKCYYYEVVGNIFEGVDK